MALLQNLRKGATSHSQRNAQESLKSLICDLVGSSQQKTKKEEQKENEGMSQPEGLKLLKTWEEQFTKVFEPLATLRMKRME